MFGTVNCNTRVRIDTTPRHRRLLAVQGRMMLFLSLGIVAGIAAPTSAHELPGLIAKWPAEGNAKDVVGDNDGRLVGDVTFVRGKVGRAFKFDGHRDFVRINDAIELTPRVITVECWYSAVLTSASASFDIIPLVNKFTHNTEDAVEDSYALGLTLDGGVRWQVDTFKDGELFDNILQLQSGDLPEGVNTLDGRLHHIAGTYDGSRLVVYLDGIALGSLPAFGRVNNGSARLLFGAAFSVDKISWFQRGRLDQVKIYNRALSAKEIARIAGRS